MAETTDKTTELSLLVKNPAGAADAQVKVPASATIGDVKRTLSREYSGNPEPSLQTVQATAVSLIVSICRLRRLLSERYLQVIYAGKVLKDEHAKLSEVAKQVLSFRFIFPIQ